MNKKEKIFCIGYNKTGTTTMKVTLKELGYQVAPQRPIEYLGRSFFNGNYKLFLLYSKFAGNAFQDFPYCLPPSYKILDRHFPGSKFIFTTRPVEDWYASVLKDASYKVGNGKIPTADQLKKSKYIRRGWRWEKMVNKYNVSEDDPFNKTKLTKAFIDYNNSVRKHFQGRTQDFIEISVYNPSDYNKLTDFLDKTPVRSTFPWANKSPEINYEK